ncbi:MAG TPA: hypothetical protein VF633_14810 [Brevundimonas sp.]|jgi:hypothetical protein
MQALLELIAAFIAMLAMAALSQFGVDLHRPSMPEREVHRVIDCREASARTEVISTSAERC